MKKVWILLLAIRPAFCDCVQLNGEEIRARDLASRVEAFTAADPDTILGLAPAPGVRRLLSMRDLLSAAHRTGVSDKDLPTSGVCFERSVRELTDQELTLAMAGAFPDTPVRITIVDHSRYGVPAGSVAFQLTGLNMPPLLHPDAPVLWRGRVIYSRTRSMEIWATVLISATMLSCRAVTDIPPGKPVAADQIRIARLPHFPLRRTGVIEDAGSIVGRVTRRPIRAGQEIVVQDLEEAREIRAGDLVRVLAVSGNARISLDALATSGGRKGEAIMLKNPTTHACFRATVAGRDRAVVQAGLGDGS